MGTRPKINLADLPPDVRKKLREQQGIKKPRKPGISKDAVRTAAFRMLAVVADMTAGERRRVLTHAGKLNSV